MVRGRAMAVAAVAPMNQCAEITSSARGCGSVCPSRRHALVKSLSSSVFIGLPWPMNSAGILSLVIGALPPGAAMANRPPSRRCPSGAALLRLHDLDRNAQPVELRLHLGRVADDDPRQLVRVDRRLGRRIQLRRASASDSGWQASRNNCRDGGRAGSIPFRP